MAGSYQRLNRASSTSFQQKVTPLCAFVSVSMLEWTPSPCLRKETTFSPSDLRLFHFLRYFRIFFSTFFLPFKTVFHCSVLTDAQMFRSSYEEPEQRQEGNTLSPKQTGWGVQSTVICMRVKAPYCWVLFIRLIETAGLQSKFSQHVSKHVIWR